MNDQHQGDGDATRKATPTLDEIQTWPAVVGVEEAASAFGISRSHAYDLIRRGDFPVTVISLGQTMRVSTDGIVRLLSGTPR